MARNRQSAKKAGTAFESLIAAGLREALQDERIQRAPRWGAKDQGDIVNVYLDGYKIVIQTKDVARTSLPAWARDAKVQAENANALAGIVIHKRYGSRDPMEQWVTMTLRELVALITKRPSHLHERETNDDTCQPGNAPNSGE